MRSPKVVTLGVGGSAIIILHLERHRTTRTDCRYLQTCATAFEST